MTGEIDLDKVGSGIFDMIEWRYYVGSDTLNLTYSIESYPKDPTLDTEGSDEISHITFEFLDLKNWNESIESFHKDDQTDNDDRPSPKTGKKTDFEQIEDATNKLDELLKIEKKGRKYP